MEDTMLLYVGVAATVEIRENLANEYHFFSPGKTHKNQENSRNMTVTQKGKRFTSLAYVRLVPCAQVVSIDWLAKVAF